MEVGSSVYNDNNGTVLRQPRTQRQSRLWQIFGRRVPRSENRVCVSDDPYLCRGWGIYLI